MSDAAEHHGHKHPYHLVDPSPWPAVGALAGAALTFGLVMFMHPGIFGEGLEPALKALGVWLLAPGVILVVLTMWFWWKDVIQEATFDGYHTPIVQLGMRYGMALFICSEVMFFAAFFWAFFEASLYPKELPYDLPGGIWPPQGIEAFDPWDIPFLNTLILLTSGVTVTWAHHALREGDKDGLVKGLALTIILGALFTSLQAYEYIHAPFGFSDGIYGSTFYMATGFHGAHVIIGTTFLTVCWFRARADHFKPEHHFGFEAAAWYWHFVDVVWLFLFSCVYWWGGA
ncbi:MAG: cytochrome c oxidase subunit 3 [Alphaproteobacteria bacterium]|jgi:cytochrome c oxidase subunit 3|nr:cytochrome c oxidase subunit 3 [Alphaproteobacteria bacterium]